MSGRAKVLSSVLSAVHAVERTLRPRFESKRRCLRQSTGVQRKISILLLGFSGEFVTAVGQLAERALERPEPHRLRLAFRLARAGGRGAIVARDRLEHVRPRRGAKKSRREAEKPRRGAKKPRRDAEKPRRRAKKPRRGAKKPRRGAKKPRWGAKKPRRGAKKPRRRAKKPRRRAKKDRRDERKDT
jgi:hypothetical protein